MQVSKNHIKSSIGKFLEILFHLSVLYFILFPLLNPGDWISSFFIYLLFGGTIVIVAHPIIKKDLGDGYLSIYFLVFIVVVIFWGLLYIFAIIWTILESIKEKYSQEVELKVEIEVV